MVSLRQCQIAMQLVPSAVSLPLEAAGFGMELVEGTGSLRSKAHCDLTANICLSPISVPWSMRLIRGVVGTWLAEFYSDTDHHSVGRSSLRALTSDVFEASLLSAIALEE